MDDNFLPGRKYPDDEFSKMYDTLRDMLVHMQNRSDLIRHIREEKSIPDHARDLAEKAVSSELAGNKIFFFNYLLNFIGLSMQGLHTIDIIFDFGIMDGDILKIDRCSLIIYDEETEIPVEIGREYIDRVFDTLRQDDIKAVIQFYQGQETHYDTLFGGVSGRCALIITEELYPGHRVQVMMKLPAQTLIEQQIAL